MTLLDKIRGLGEKRPKIPKRDKLVVLSPPYFSVKTREEGERELIDLAKTADLEGLWLYFDSNTTWVYMVEKHLIITGEKQGFGVTGIEIDYSNIGKNQTLYHIHLKHLENQDYDSMLAKVEKEGKKLILTPEEERKIRNVIAATDIMPSLEDINTYKKIIGNSNEGGPQFKIGSPYGILTVELDPGRMPLKGTCQRYEERPKLEPEFNLEDELWIDTQKSIGLGINRINQYMGGGLKLSMEFDPRGVA